MSVHRGPPLYYITPVMSCFVSGHKMVQTHSAATTTAAQSHIFPCFDNSTEIIIQKRDVSHVTTLQVFTHTVRRLS